MMEITAEERKTEFNMSTGMYFICVRGTNSATIYSIKVREYTQAIDGFWLKDGYTEIFKLERSQQ